MKKQGALTQEALRLFVENLEPGDTFALYGAQPGAARILPSTPLAEKTRVLKAVEDLHGA